MKENNPFREDREQLRELLKQYENFKNGRNHSFIEEDAFENIISSIKELLGNVFRKESPYTMAVSNCQDY